MAGEPLGAGGAYKMFESVERNDRPDRPDRLDRPVRADSHLGGRDSSSGNPDPALADSQFRE